MLNTPTPSDPDAFARLELAVAAQKRVNTRLRGAVKRQKDVIRDLQLAAADLRARNRRLKDDLGQ